MCGHGPKISRSRLSIFYFHRTNSPNPWRPDLKENEAVGAAIWQNHLSHFVWFYRNFCFPSRFFKPRWSIAFFSCTRVSQVGRKLPNLIFGFHSLLPSFRFNSFSSLSLLLPFPFLPFRFLYGVPFASTLLFRPLLPPHRFNASILL